MRNMRLSPAKRIALSGVMTVIALLFSYVETFIPMPIVGMKLGLANMIPLLMISTLGIPNAACISILRIFLSSLLFGTPVSFLYSLAGGIASFIVISLMTRLKTFSLSGVSCAGGVAHNIGQIAIAAIAFKTTRIAVLLPVLILSGTVAGFLVGLLATLILPRLKFHF